MALQILPIIVLILFFAFPILYSAIGGVQAKEMMAGSSFTRELNKPDETPYGINDLSYEFRDITWSTFRGNQWNDFGWSVVLLFFINPFGLFDFDGMVDGGSVPLNGAINYGPYPRNHNEVLNINDLTTDSLFLDLFYELTTIRNS